MQKSRNTGLDLLRVIAMLMIVVLHFVNKGELFAAIGGAKVNYAFTYVIYRLSLVGVHCYVLISAYFLVNSRFKLKNIALLWGEVLFWSIAIAIPFLISRKTGGTKELLGIFLPVSMTSYWFVTTYIVMYAMFPFLNRIIHSLNKRTMELLIVFMLIVFSVWKTFMPFAGTLDETGGHGIIFFVCLYMIGAYIRLYGLKISSGRSLMLYLLFIAADIGMTAVYKMMAKLPGIEIASAAGYNELFLTLASVALFNCFRNIKLKNAKVGAVVSDTGMLTIGVYLIHEQIVLRKVLWSEIIPCKVIAGSPLYILLFIAVVIGVFTVCICMEKVRRLIAQKSGISRKCADACDALETRIRKWAAGDRQER